MKPIVFLGPTLTASAAQKVLDAIYLPPAKQGDVYCAARHNPLAIAIVDGYFDHTAAVWHKEILWALSRGIPVFGSASMGALRAAELNHFGMQGVGWIYEAYRDGVLEDDDEVALTHLPGIVEGNFAPVSEPLVNIRRTLSKAEFAGLVCSNTRLTLEAIAKGLYYPYRCYERLLLLGLDRGLPMGEIAAFRDWVLLGRVDQKREDAIEMLCIMRSRLEKGSGPGGVSFIFESTDAWRKMVRRHTSRSSQEEPGRGDGWFVGQYARHP